MRFKDRFLHTPDVSDPADFGFRTSSVEMSKFGVFVKLPILRLGAHISWSEKFKNAKILACEFLKSFSY